MKLLLLSLTLTCGLLAQGAFQVKVSGHGQPMILIPGLSSSGETWDTTVAHYKDHFECHVLTVAGFAGVPRVPAPILDRVRDGLADYIRQEQDREAGRCRSQPRWLRGSGAGRQVPRPSGQAGDRRLLSFLRRPRRSRNHPGQGRENVAQMRQYMAAQTQDMYERYVKSGLATRMMVTKDSDFDRIVAWGLASDRTAVTDAMCELFAADLRDDLANIKEPHAGPGHLDRPPASTPTARRPKPISAPVRQAGRRGYSDHRHRAPLHNVG